MKELDKELREEIIECMQKAPKMALCALLLTAITHLQNNIGNDNETQVANAAAYSGMLHILKMAAKAGG